MSGMENPKRDTVADQLARAMTRLKSFVVRVASPISLPTTWRTWLIDQPRLAKRMMIIASDFLLLAIAVCAAFSLRWGRFYVPENMTLAFVMLSAPLIGVVVFHTFGLYRIVTRFLGRHGAMRIFGGVGLSVLLWAVAVLMTTGTNNPEAVVPRTVIFLYTGIACLLVWMSRVAAALLLGGTRQRALERSESRRVVIYGAGERGAQLLAALRRTTGYLPVGFIDDTPSLIGQNVAGLKVYRVDKLSRLVERDGVKEVLLALPESRWRERRQIVAQLAEHPVRVKAMPAIEDIASGRVAVTDLRPIDVDDLLGREPVPPVADLLARSIRGKTVMITGAGGSIGSELARQIVRQSPRTLVLFELSEAALYQIETELDDVFASWKVGDAAHALKPEIVGVLGSVLDKDVIRRTIERYSVQTVYHAAAYKHVPIVEANAVAGLRNNVYGTLNLAEVAERTGVERVVLISTDKAVRPTNVMGASKRMAELIFQATAADNAGSTIFAIVRFGNVLDSSGSVVGRFRKQIQNGGPVTVTHPDVIRYFMSIPEAATLVIQAGAMARGGEVFLLDMGEPVKIADLARTMVQLMGLEVQDGENPEGDIAIKYVGLRPGEKLYEELLIDEQAARTEHPRIRRNAEPFRPRAVLAHELETLAAAMMTGDIEQIHAILSRSVEGYQPDTTATAVHAAATWIPNSRTLH